MHSNPLSPTLNDRLRSPPPRYDSHRFDNFNHQPVEGNEVFWDSLHDPPSYNASVSVTVPTAPLLALPRAEETQESGHDKHEETSDDFTAADRFKKISEWKANANIIALLVGIIFFAGFLIFLTILS